MKTTPLQTCTLRLRLSQYLFKEKIKIRRKNCSPFLTLQILFNAWNLVLDFSFFNFLLLQEMSFNFHQLQGILSLKKS